MIHDPKLARAPRIGNPEVVQVIILPAPASAIERKSTVWCLGVCLFTALAFAIPAVIR